MKTAQGNLRSIPPENGPWPAPVRLMKPPLDESPRPRPLAAPPRLARRSASRCSFSSILILAASSRCRCSSRCCRSLASLRMFLGLKRPRADGAGVGVDDFESIVMARSGAFAGPASPPASGTGAGAGAGAAGTSSSWDSTGASAEAVDEAEAPPRAAAPPRPPRALPLTPPREPRGGIFS